MYTDFKLYFYLSRKSISWRTSPQSLTSWMSSIFGRSEYGWYCTTSVNECGWELKIESAILGWSTTCSDVVSRQFQHTQGPQGWKSEDRIRLGVDKVVLADELPLAHSICSVTSHGRRNPITRNFLSIIPIICVKDPRKCPDPWILGQK